MSIDRRALLSGLAVPAAAGLGLAQLSSEQTAGEQAASQQLPGLPDPGIPALTEATVDLMLTEAAADALAEHDISFTPAPGAAEVPDAVRPATRLAMSVGSAALDLLDGTVHVDGGFALTREGAPEDTARLVFASIASQLAESIASAWLWINGEPGDRIPALVYDLSASVVDLDGPDLTVTEVPIFLTEEAVAAIREVFQDAPVGTDLPFLDGSAVGTFDLPSLPPL